MIINKLDEFLKVIYSALNNKRLSNTDYKKNYDFNPNDTNDVLKFIVKNKLKPVEKKKFSKEFGELLILWNKEVNNYNQLYPNQKLKSRLNDLQGTIESEIKNEQTKIDFERQNPTINNIENEAISEYHAIVYKLYKYVAEVMERYLQEIYNEYAAKDLTGGKKRQTKKKSKKSKKRQTLKK